jgi:hypothetical protein
MFYCSGGTIMNLTASRPLIKKTISGAKVRSGTVYAVIIVSAMIAFETFNYSTTAFSLQDLLGNLKFAGIPWSTFLALAFCGIDFAGIARLIAPENRKTDLKESWYLFGAWLIAATANAALTWWGVAVAMSGHTLKSSAIINLDTLTKVVPVFVAILVWVIRILIIASLSSALARTTAKKENTFAHFESDENDLDQTPFSKPVSHQQARPLTMTRISHSASSDRSQPAYANRVASSREHAGNKSRIF